MLWAEPYYAIFAAFRSEGITIPFPQRDLHLKSADSDSHPGMLRPDGE